MDLRKCLVMHNFLLVLILLNVTFSPIHGNLYKFNAKQTSPSNQRKETAVKNGGTLNNLVGRPGEGFYLEVEIGTPKQRLNVLIDTGSSNFAVACDSSLNVNKFFDMEKSSSFEDTGKTVYVPYTEGSWSGILGRDKITISSLPNVTVMANIACITKEDNFFINGSNWQGIFGLGYAAIAKPDSSVQPVFETMVQDGKVEDRFSVDLCGIGTEQENGTITGTIVFGSSDPPLYTGKLYPTPINLEWYYEVIILDILVNGDSLDMDCKEYNFDRTIVDTGTTNLRLPTRVFDNLVSKMNNSLHLKPPLVRPNDEFWSGMELICFESGLIPYDNFPSVTLKLPVNGTSSLELVVTAQQYLRLVTDEAQPGTDCFKFGISSISQGSVIGAVVMEGFYVLFDRQHKQVQFGNTTCPPADPNTKASYLIQKAYTGNYKDCAYKHPDAVTDGTIMKVVYVLVVICIICVIPLLVLIQQRYCRKLCKRGKRFRTESESPVTDYMVDNDS